MALAAAHALAVASPGPDFAIVTKNTLNWGKRAGRMTALGIGVAILLHVFYALVGFTVLVKSTPIIYQAIKFSGALYLAYIGYSELTAQKLSSNTFASHQRTRHQPSDLKNFQNGFLTNALNVKALLFFLFLFTSIVAAHRPLNIKLIYGAWLCLSTTLWFYIVATFLGQQAVRIWYIKHHQILNRVMGLLLLSLAFYIVLT